MLMKKSQALFNCDEYSLFVFQANIAAIKCYESMGFILSDYPDDAAVSNETTVLACQLYFWARLVHYVVYAAGIPWVRTLSYAASWLCIVALILQLL